MLIYIESNFVLELALQQEEVSFADDIMKLAESGKVQLVFPTFALSEPFSTLTYRGIERKRLSAPLKQELGQLARSSPFQALAAQHQPLPDELNKVIEVQMLALQAVVGRLLDVGRAIETDTASFQQALMYRTGFNLAPQDSIIYATVVADLRKQPVTELKCLLNRNTKDFGKIPIKTELAGYNCEYKGTFQAGLAYIQSKIQ